jgi:acyl carrier protein
MTMAQETQEKLIDFICRNFMIERNEFELDKSLIDQGVIDSFGLVEISAFLKSEFAISVEQSEMIRDNFGSVLKIVDFIERKCRHE